MNHPAWCDQETCRAASGGAHVGGSTPIEDGSARVSVYLYQAPDQIEPVIMWSGGWRGVGHAVPMPLAMAERVAERLDVVLAEARTEASP